MKWIFAGLWMVGVAALAQQAVTLAWDASPDTAQVAGYRVHYGEISGEYTFSTNAGLVLTQTVTVPHPADWFFAVTAVGMNQLESDFSNEVMWRAPVGPPEVEGVPMVRLVPQLERSTNEVEWGAFTGVPTYVPATNAMEVFRNVGLMIERVKLVNNAP